METVSADPIHSLLSDLAPRLWTFALRLSGNSCYAEELVLRAYLHALEHFHEQETLSLSSMYSIISSIWASELRSRSVRACALQPLEEEIVTAVSAFAAPAPETHRTHQKTLAAVNALPEDQRIVMLLVAVEGFSYTEAATILDVSVNTITSRLVSARLAIGKQFESDVQ